MVETRLLRRILSLKMEEVAGRCRRLHNEELHDLHFSPNNIRVVKLGRIRWSGHVARMGEMRNAYRILIGKLEDTTRKT
jgi:hypothetical protein